MLKWIICGALLLGFLAHADEKVGEFFIENAFIHARYSTIENAGTEFDFSDSLFAIRWRRDRRLSTYFSVGSLLARSVPVYYAEPVRDELGFYEAHAEYDGPYGRFRAGLIPINFAYDGLIPADQRFFKKARPMAERLVGMTDYGASFRTENKGYYTELIGHNGEVHTQSDGRLWVTGHWGYFDNRKFRAQVSVQTGSVRKEVSTGNSNTIAGVDNNQNAKWRHAALLVQYFPRPWNFVIQGMGGSVLQGTDEGNYFSHLVEVSYNFSQALTVGVRHENFDPNEDISNDRSTDISLLLLVKNRDATSNFYVLGTKVLEQGYQVPNDELRVGWVLTPFTR